MYQNQDQMQTNKRKISAMEENDLIAVMTTTKHKRTKVCSGSNSNALSKVWSLKDTCVRLVIKNLDSVTCTGGAQFNTLEPILKHATPDQLYTIEYHNNYLIKETGSLWEYHCKKMFCNKTPSATESWKDVYIQHIAKRETKLIQLRRKINEKTELERKNIRKIAVTQANVHTATEARPNILKKSVIPGNAQSQSSNYSSARSIEITTRVPTNCQRKSSSAITKKKAPLMQKALKHIKIIKAARGH